LSRGLKAAGIDIRWSSTSRPVMGKTDQMDAFGAVALLGVGLLQSI
jgi:hypothetical protein